MKSTSSGSARGSRLGSSTGVSVVPTTTLPCHGTANSTRPSVVCGTMIAVSPGRNSGPSTRWIPWLSVIMGAALGLSIRSTGR